MVSNESLLAFVRKVVLTPTVISPEIREEALNLLLNEYVPEAELNVNINNVGWVTMNRSDYQLIADHWAKGEKISAIKALRGWYCTKHRDLLGLKDAKDTCEKWFA